jgi:hypothetical protein
MISNKLTVLAVGFGEGGANPLPDHINWLEINPADSKYISGLEQYGVLNKLGSTCDLVVIQLNRVLLPYEVVLLHIVYSKLTTILGVGSLRGDDLIIEDCMIANRFASFGQLVDHLQEFYL